MFQVSFEGLGMGGGWWCSRYREQCTQIQMRELYLSATMWPLRMGIVRGDGRDEIKILAGHGHRLLSEQMVRSLNLKLQVSTAAAARSLQSCPTLCNPIDGSPPGSPSLGFSRQEHWSGLPFPSPVHKSEK